MSEEFDLEEVYEKEMGLKQKRFGFNHKSKYEEFLAKNKERIERFQNLQENSPYNTGHRRALFKKHNLKRIFKGRKVRLSETEIDNLIWEVINDYPGGLLIQEVEFFSGLPKKTVKNSLNRLVGNNLSPANYPRRIFVREVTLDVNLYYPIKDRKIRKLLEEREKEIKQIKDKVGKLNNG